MVFLKLVHTESQVNHKTQPFWVKVVHLVANVQILAGHAIGTIGLAPSTTLQSLSQASTEYTSSLFPMWGCIPVDAPLLRTSPEMVVFVESIMGLIKEPF